MSPKPSARNDKDGGDDKDGRKGKIETSDRAREEGARTERSREKRPDSWRDVRDMLSFLGAYWPLYIVCIFLNICANLAYGPGIAYSLAVLTDSITAKEISLVWRAARLLGLMAAAMGALGGISHFLSNWTLEAVALNIRRKVMSRALRANLSYWHIQKTGDTVSLLVNDTETAKQGLSLLHGLVGDIGLIVSCVVTLIAWGPGTALALFVLAALCMFVGARFAEPVGKVSDEYQAETANTTSAATELLSGIAVVKSLKAEPIALGRALRTVDRLYGVARKRGRLLGLQYGATAITQGLSSVGVLIVAAFLSLRGRMTVGQAVGVMQLASLPLNVFGSLGESWATIQQNLAASRRLKVSMEIPVERDAGDALAEGSPDARGALQPDARAALHPDPRMAPRPEVQTGLQQSHAHTALHPEDTDFVLEFDSVTFGYDRERAVLDGACFRIRERQKAALVGPSGGGKTSVLRLIQGFYEPWEGTIKLRGKDVSSIPLKELRSQVGIVPQEPFIFPGTVRENIAMGNEQASLDEIIRAAKLANAHEFIAGLPEGYDTVLDERGGNLSGGQKQRICLARAFLKDAGLLLLDEPTSSVDAESEALIRQSVDEYASRKTVLAVSHTEGVVEGAGVVLSVADGKVTETRRRD
ncbi:MAG: ABC transporter ATP-binding protein [Bacillota bacterium]|jgi:ATP-binding cassette subfamily B protein